MGVNNEAIKVVADFILAHPQGFQMEYLFSEGTSRNCGKLSAKFYLNF